MIRTLLVLTVAFFACHNIENRNQKSDEKPPSFLEKKEPTPGKYIFDITHETSFRFSFNDQDNKTINRTHVNVGFIFSADSLKNRTIQVKYNEIQLYSKSGETVTEMDAANAQSSFLPEEKLLGMLLSRTINYTLDSNGHVIQETGIAELRENILNALPVSDQQQKTQLSQQLDQLLKQGFLKSNMDLISRSFSDKPVQPGDTWESKTEIPGDYNIDATSTFHFEKIADGKAIIGEEGKLKGNELNIPFAVTKVSATIEGKQQGTHQIDLHSNLLSLSEVKMDASGMISLMGQEVPIIIQTKIIARQVNP